MFSVNIETMQKIYRLVWGVVIIFIFSCAGGTEVGNPNSPSLVNSLNDDELETTVKTMYASGLTSSERYEKSTPAATIGNDAPNLDTKTNATDISVEEPDVIKSDGSHLFVAKDNTIAIVLQKPDPKQISTITLPGNVTSISLYNDIAVILYTPVGGEGENWQYIDPPGEARIGLPYWLKVNAKVGVAIYRVHDVEQPQLLKSLEIDGTEVSSRLINGQFHIVQQFLPDLPSIRFWYDPLNENLSAVVQENAARLLPLPLSDLVPQYTDIFPTKASGQLVDAQNFYHLVGDDRANTGGSVTTVTTIDLDNAVYPMTSVGLNANAHEVYTSDQGIYVAARSWREDEEKPNDVLQETIVYAFKITDGMVVPEAVGFTPGWILNHFSMDALSDILRLATTTETSTSTANHLYCLRSVDGGFERVGQLENFAPGAGIYSVRFIENHGFATTFDNTSPLYTIDLSQPNTPTIAGQLDIPGMVNHIYPIENDLLLAVGKHIVQDGGVWSQGLQISLIDVQAIESPELLHQVQIGDRGTSSEALLNHKAFAYDPVSGVIGLPVALFEHAAAQENPSDEGVHTFNGVYLYRVTPASGFAFLGRIDTSSGQDPATAVIPWTRGMIQPPDIFVATPAAVHSAAIDDIENTLRTVILPNVPQKKKFLGGDIMGAFVGIEEANAGAQTVTLNGLQRNLKIKNNVRLRTRSFDPMFNNSEINAHLRTRGESDPQILVEGQSNGKSDVERPYLVQFVTQAFEVFQQEITQIGARVFCPIPDHAVLVLMDDTVKEAVEKLSYVRWVGPYYAGDKLDPLIEADARESNVTPKPYSILLLDKSMNKAVEKFIHQVGGIVDLSLTSRRLEATLNGSQLLKVTALKEVLFIDGVTETGNDGVITHASSGGMEVFNPVAGYTGQGVTGEVLDHGFRITHQEFGQTAFTTRGPDTNPTDPQHGTQVASILFAKGIHPLCRALLPDAELPILASRFRLGWGGGRPTVVQRASHTKALVDPNDVYRAVFQNNSWGNLPTRQYSTVSAELDEILFETDLLVTQSQGNVGSRASRPQAWAKNVVSVGGICGMNTIERSDDNWGGKASIGPAGDGRIKPDLTHFSSHIFTASHEQDTYYSMFEGTSASSAITAGMFGVFFQMWADGVFHGGPGKNRDVFDSRPHMTTAKALMINSARQYEFSGLSHDLTRTHQGWGVADIQHLYDKAAQDHWMIPLLIDESAVISPLSTHQYRLLADGTQPIKITMVYADPPGSPSAMISRVNDLSLKVTSPSGSIYWGNYGLIEGNWSMPGGEPNSIDTVENVFIRGPETGVWTIEILADEIVQDGHVETPQIDADYALVATGGTMDAPSPGEMAHRLTIIVPTGGGVSADPMIDEYTPGTSVRLTATPGIGWRFDRWAGDVTGNQNPNTVVMDADKQVTALFSQIPVEEFSFTVSVDQDAWLKEAAPADRFGDEKELSVKNKPGDSERAVYRYDLADIPANAQISSATAFFHTTTPDIRPINVFQIVDPWAENSVNWANIGDHFDPTTIHGSFTPSQDDTTFTVDLTSLVQDWVCGTPNHGVILIATSDDNQSKFTSKDMDDQQLQPIMEVVYDTGASPCESR